MKKILLLIAFIFTGFLSHLSPSVGSVTAPEVASGLKEALSLGAKNAVQLASRVDGFYKNPLIFIPFPPEAQQMKAALERLGLKSQVDKFVMLLNRAAEEGAKEATPIFLNAIKGLTIQDGFQILKGAPNAATEYLRRQTTPQLTAAFRPVIKRAIDKVQATQVWNPLVTQYNRIPFVRKANPDLDAYVTERAIAGLFKLIANEELKIRQNPAARVSDILRKVFGS